MGNSGDRGDSSSIGGSGIVSYCYYYYYFFLPSVGVPEGVKKIRKMISKLVL